VIFSDPIVKGFNVLGGQIVGADFYSVDDTGVYILDLCVGFTCSFSVDDYGDFSASETVFARGVPTFEQVPAPGSLALLALGLAAFGVRRAKSLG
jgi:hypothetical protein